MSFFACLYDDPDTGTTTPPPVTPPPGGAWGTFYDDDVGFVPAIHGGGVGLWVDETGLEQRIQTNNSLEPAFSTSLIPGRGAIVVSADRHMVETVTLPIAAAVVIVDGLTGTRVALTIDTSATTTKPAVALVLEEY